MKKSYSKPVSCGVEMRERAIVPAIAIAAGGAAAASLAKAALSKMISEDFIGRNFIEGADKVEIVYE